MRIRAIHTHDHNNIGDQLCSPCDYFPEWGDATRRHIWTSTVNESVPTIVGGGGLLHGQLNGILASMGKAKAAPLIAWGVGHNEHGVCKIQETDYDPLLDFDLVGIRDAPIPQRKNWFHVPCASCLHTAFSEQRPDPILPFVVFEHHLFPVDLPWFARMSNDCHGFHSLFAILDFLALGEKVITSSYHGAYWAMLIGRPVAVWKPFSSKFQGMCGSVKFCDDTDWWAVLKTLPLPPENYLEKCRNLNYLFADHVRTVLSS